MTTHLIYYVIAVCKDSYVAYACGFDWNGKWEWFVESMRINVILRHDVMIYVMTTLLTLRDVASVSSRRL